MVPNDDEHTTRFLLYSTPQEGEDAQRTLRYFEQYSSYNPADHHDALFEGKFPQEPFIQLTSAQDYIAAVGQGAIADTANELLGWSDMGIMTLRRIFWRELDAARTGCPTKHWKRLPTSVEMPTQPGALQAATQ
jgi:5,5'-dehydrodivanillate O-demethylase